jgi:hypothetical protein
MAALRAQRNAMSLLRAAAAMLLFQAAAADSNTIAAASPLVLWSGRATRVNNAVTFDWESTAATLAVNGVGASISAELQLPAPLLARFSVYVNGQDAANLMASNATSTYLLAAGLPFAANNVTIVFAFEPGYSQANRVENRTPHMLSFTVTDGSFAAPAPLARRIDVIGDSITAGSMYDRLEAVGSPLGLNTGCDPWSAPTGMSSAFSWWSYLARALNANASTVAWSGKGLIHNSGCHEGPLLPELYGRAFATGTESEPWDFSRATPPDAVIVYLGTNDFSCNETTTAAFSAALVEFWANITQLYSGSRGGGGGGSGGGGNNNNKNNITFFAALGPMSPTAPAAAVASAIATARAAGMSAALLDMRSNGSSVVALDGCGEHPGPFGHWTMATLAVPQVKQVMGW